jgi:hypothetical protein
VILLLQFCGERFEAFTASGDEEKPGPRIGEG